MKSNVMISQNPFVYSPTFRVTESISTDFSDAKVGGKIKALVSYEVVEITKSYAVLRINFFSTIKSKRV